MSIPYVYKVTIKIMIIFIIVIQKNITALLIKNTIINKKYNVAINSLLKKITVTVTML